MHVMPAAYYLHASQNFSIFNADELHYKNQGSFYITRIFVVEWKFPRFSNNLRDVCFLMIIRAGELNYYSYSPAHLLFDMIK